MGNYNRPRYLRFVTSYDTTALGGSKTADVQTYVRKLRRERTGADDPMYKSRIGRGLSATNALTVLFQDWTFTHGSVRVRNVAPGRAGDGAISSSSSLVLPDLPVDVWFGSINADAENKAAIGIRKRIHDQKTSWSGLTFLGELRESIHMIRHPAQALRDMSVNFFHRTYAAKQRVPKRKFMSTLADSWLEFAFGAQPLVSDITSLAEAALPKLQEPSIKRISYTAQAAVATSKATRIGVGGIFAKIPYSVDVIDEASCRFLVGYRVTPQGPTTALQRIIELGGFNLSEILPTAWELLPWSFFVDYFSNIGDVISTNLVSLEDLAWSQRTMRSQRLSREVARGSAAVPDEGSSTVFVGGSDMVSNATWTVLTRAAAGIPFSELRFELPGRTNQFLNIVALAQSVLVNPRRSL